MLNCVKIGCQAITWTVDCEIYYQCRACCSRGLTWNKNVTLVKEKKMWHILCQQLKTKDFIYLQYVINK